MLSNLVDAVTNASSTEEALRESEERFRGLFDDAPIAYHEIDSNGVVLRVNQVECELLGYDPAAMTGRHIWEFVAEDERDASRTAVLEKVAQIRPLKTFARDYVRKDGTRLVVEVHENLIRNSHGAVTGIRSALLDITARKRAEESLERQAQELSRSNLELQQFAYVASHDLQEPLRKIQAFGDLLKTRYADTLSEQGRDYLTRMQNAAGRMQLLINDLLSLSRAGTRRQMFASVDLNNVTNAVLSDLEIRIEQLGATVNVGSLPTIEADAVQLTQLIQNLVGNSLKFHKPNESPVVTVSSKVLLEEGICELTIADNGIGFDEKYLDRIFQVFQRLHGRTEYEGTGVGLAVCRRIVERHGGTITAHSIQGEGAQFVVTLPIEQIKESNKQ